MATLTPASLGATGADLTMAAATSGGDSIASAEGAVLLVTNGDASSKTVTFTGSVECSQGSTHDEAVVVAAGKTRPIPVPSRAVSATDGTAAVTYSAVTSVTVAAYKA